MLNYKKKLRDFLLQIIRTFTMIFQNNGELLVILCMNYAVYQNHGYKMADKLLIFFLQNDRALRLQKHF